MRGTILKIRKVHPHPPSRARLTSIVATSAVLGLAMSTLAPTALAAPNFDFTGSVAVADRIFGDREFDVQLEVSRDANDTDFDREALTAAMARVTPVVLEARDAAYAAASEYAEIHAALGETLAAIDAFINSPLVTVDTLNRLVAAIEQVAPHIERTREVLAPYNVIPADVDALLEQFLGLLPALRAAVAAGELYGMFTGQAGLPLNLLLNMPPFNQYPDIAEYIALAREGLVEAQAAFASLPLPAEIDRVVGLFNDTVVAAVALNDALAVGIGIVPARDSLVVALTVIGPESGPVLAALAYAGVPQHYLDVFAYRFDQAARILADLNLVAYTPTTWAVGELVATVGDLAGLPFEIEITDGANVVTAADLAGALRWLAIAQISADLDIDTSAADAALAELLATQTALAGAQAELVVAEQVILDAEDGLAAADAAVVAAQLAVVEAESAVAAATELLAEVGAHAGDLLGQLDAIVAARQAEIDTWYEVWGADYALAQGFTAPGATITIQDLYDAAMRMAEIAPQVAGYVGALSGYLGQYGTYTYAQLNFLMQMAVGMVAPQILTAVRATIPTPVVVPVVVSDALAAVVAAADDAELLAALAVVGELDTVGLPAEIQEVVGGFVVAVTEAQTIVTDAEGTLAALAAAVVVAEAEVVVAQGALGDAVAARDAQLLVVAAAEHAVADAQAKVDYFWFGYHAVHSALVNYRVGILRGEWAAGIVSVYLTVSLHAQAFGYADAVWTTAPVPVEPYFEGTETPDTEIPTVWFQLFHDVHESEEHSAFNPFHANIHWLYHAGIATGWTPVGDQEFPTFRGSNQITREAMAAFLFRAAGSPEFELPAEPTFSDIAGSAFGLEIEWLHAAGVTLGWADGTFRPGSPVTREAFAAFLHRFHGAPSLAEIGSAPFADVTAGDTFHDHISWLSQYDITEGWTEDDGSVTFRPATPVTREAMAAFLHRAHTTAFGGVLDAGHWMLRG